MPWGVNRLERPLLLYEGMMDDTISLDTAKRRRIFGQYDKRQRIAAWIWVLGPALLVGGGLIANWVGPVEDGIELEPETAAEASVSTTPEPKQTPTQR